jgi:hypothetical protein
MAARPAPWPNNAYQLLPHGPEDTVRGLLCWLAIDVGATAKWASLLGYFRVLLVLTRPLTLPYMVTSPARVLSGIIATLDREFGHMTTYMQAGYDSTQQERTITALSTCARFLGDVAYAADKVQRQELTRALICTASSGCDHAFLEHAR